jgi:tetratricopeptide (TPR) repeat protein/transposase
MSQIDQKSHSPIPRVLRANLGNMRRVLETYDFVLLGQDIVQLLSELKKARPDIDEFHVWAEKYAPTLSDQAECLDLVGVNKTLIILLEMIAGNRSDTGNILDMIQDLEAKLVAQPDAEDFTALLKDFLQGIESFVAIIFETIGSTAKLPITIDGDAVRIGSNAKISFNRTLRIPEDGRDYPLPAGFGRLPICRVEDYADKVPSKWLQEGGFFIPLYQKEALFLEFEGAKWRPNAAKVAVGRVNAVTGDNYDEKIRPHKQDYLVIPDQKYLDGINSGEGRVGQFVAMPLGKGYTIEAQVTDEEVHGGFQLVVFDPQEGRFPNDDPVEAKNRKNRFDRRKHPIIAGAAVHAAPVTPAGGLFMPKVDDGRLYSPSHPGVLHAGSRGEVTEMGIARGGNIKQEIIEDTYGSESWNEDFRGSITIHIVNSEMFSKITGQKPPLSPITSREYAKYKIPWYDSYDENAPALQPGKIFQHVKPVAALEKIKGVFAINEHESIVISPEFLRKIKTPTKAERIAEYIERAESSLRSGFVAVALRESSCALDLLRGSSNTRNSFITALQIRGEANLAMGRFVDAEGDASDCLDWDYKNISALSTRAQALFKMGEQKLAIDDAKRILSTQPDHPTGRKIVVDGILSEHLTMLVAGRYAAEGNLQQCANFADNSNEEDSRSFIEHIEDNTSHPDAEIEEIIKDANLREIGNLRRDAVRRISPLRFGIFIKHFYSQIWNKEALSHKDASDVLMHHLLSVNARSKHRSIPFISDVIKLGLVPISYHPVDLLRMKWWEMGKFSAAQNLLDDFAKIGLIERHSSLDQAPAGWEEIDTRLYSVQLRERDLFGPTGNSTGGLNLLDLLTPDQRKEVAAKDVRIFKLLQDEEIEASGDIPLWAPSEIARALNSHLTPGQQNYENLTLDSELIRLSNLIDAQ